MQHNAAICMCDKLRTNASPASLQTLQLQTFNSHIQQLTQTAGSQGAGSCRQHNPATHCSGNHAANRVLAAMLPADVSCFM